ncbi:hypothetical protein R3P38DRAFT_2913704 [Favolaschia claudopus]|uniref:PWWP domain-containing protein n=1 Tax=Favolaschia claudopus TaxID=2862362 RepID=A0AAW0C7U6_9AGAR
MDLARNPIVPGDFVLAKLKGYPSWPAMVVFPETLPEQVACARHCAASHAVMFYPDCDFAWVETAQIQLIRARLLEKPNLVNKPDTDSKMALSTAEDIFRHPGSFDGEYRVCRQNAHQD